MAISDNLPHQPPTSGEYAYNTWKPGATGFPGVGGTYVDPVFNETIRRLTNTAGPPPAATGSNIYSRNGWFNADGTRFLQHLLNGTCNVHDTTTGQVTNSGVPTGDIGTEMQFDPVDPNIYYYYSGSTIKRYNISTGQTVSDLKMFPTTLQELGGSVDWIDRSGRYFVVRFGDGIYIYDKQTDTIYTGSIAAAGGMDGWVGITPNGSHLILSGQVGSQSSQEHRSYLINHETKTLNTSGTLFWTLGGAHADLVSASNGKTYWVGLESTSSDASGLTGFWRVDITLPQSAGNQQQQRSQNMQITSSPSLLDAGHVSCAAKAGPMQNWAFISVSSGDDPFNGGVSPWRPLKSEIVMADVLTGEVRRLCHHRSRDTFGNYYHHPRVCAAWDGSRIAWVSNYNYAAGYVDLYSMVISPTPQTGTEPPPPPPVSPDPPPPPGSPFTDNFNRGSLGLGWEVIEGGPWQIMNNAARPSVPQQFTAIRRAEANFPADQYSQCEVERDITGEVAQGGVLVRSSSPNTYYFAQITSASTVTLYKRLAGVNTVIGSATVTIAPNTLVKLKLVATGTTLTVYLNDTLVITANNQTDITSGRPGLVQGRETSFADHDNFECTAWIVPPPPKITDNFDRASLGSGWEIIEGSAWQTVNNATAQPTVAYQHTAIRRTELNFPADQYAQCETEREATGDESRGGVIVRANASNTYYYAMLYGPNNNNQVVLAKRINGSNTIIASVTQGFADNTLHKLKLEAIGTTLKVYLNDALVITENNQTDIASGKPGMIQATGDAPFADHDNFECTAPA